MLRVCPSITPAMNLGLQRSYQVHTATPVRQQCAGSPLGIRVSGERLGTKNKNPGNADLRTGARWKFPNRA